MLRRFPWSYVAASTVLRYPPGKTPKEEDADMRAKEAELRASMQAAYGGVGQGQQQQGQQPPPPSNTANIMDGPEAIAIRLNSSKAFNAFSWFLLIYVLIGIFFVRPKMDQVAGVPWWATSPDMVARWMLHRMILGYQKQNAIQKEFEAAALLRPDMSYSQYMDQSYPDLYRGNRTTQPEIITALAACYAMAGDPKFIATMKAASKGSKVPSEQVDMMMDKMRTLYPHVFA